MRPFIRSTLRISFYILVIWGIIGSLSDWPPKYLKEIQQARDLTRVKDIDGYATYLNQPEASLSGLDSLYLKEHRDPKTCYYFSSAGYWYIVAARFESDEYRKKYDNRFYIRTKPIHLSLSESQWKDIENVTSKPCITSKD